MKYFINLLIVINTLFLITGCCLNSVSHISVEAWDSRTNSGIKLFDLNELNKHQLKKLSSIIKAVSKKDEKAHKNIVFAMMERSNRYQLYIVTYDDENITIARKDLDIDSKSKEICLSYLKWINDFDFDYRYVNISVFFTKAEISKLITQNEKKSVVSD